MTKNPILGIAVIYIGLAALCLFIPWMIPVPAVRSESYALGFSNIGFLACLFLLLIGPFYLHLRFSHEIPWSPHPAAQDDQKADYAITAKWMRNLSGAGFAVCAIFLLVNFRSLVGFGEAEYFLMRSALLESGKIPYADFQYAYGPLLIYDIFYLKKMGFSSGFSEALLVILESVIGYLSAYFVTITLFGEARPAARMVFWTLCLSTCLADLMGGQNYTFLRFTAVSALGCYVLSKRDTERNETYGLLSGPLFLLGWVISPEVGIVVSLAFGSTIAMISKRIWIGFIAVVLSLTATVYFVPLIGDSLSVILQFSKGGYNFPAFPSFHILLLLFSVLLSTAYVARRSAKEDPIGWFIYLCSIGLLPGALGRCDPGHVSFYAFGFFLLAGRFLVEYQGAHRFLLRYCQIYGAGYFVIWLVGLAFIDGHGVAAATAKSFFLALPDAYRDGLIERIPAPYHDKAMHLLSPNLGDEQLDDLISPDTYFIEPSSAIIGTGQVNIPYFVTLHNASTAETFKNLSDEIRGKTLVVPYGFVAGLCRPWKTDYKLLSELFLFPAHAFKQRNHPEIVTDDFCALLKNAEIVSEGVPGGYSKLAIH